MQDLHEICCQLVRSCRSKEYGISEDTALIPDIKVPLAAPCKPYSCSISGSSQHSVASLPFQLRQQRDLQAC